MNDVELYNEIGKWINIFHRRDWYYTGLLKDFQHDLYLRMRGKSVNQSYIRQRCYHYPISAIQNLYYKRTKDYVKREVVLLDENGAYVEFPDYPFEFELPNLAKPPKKSKYRKNHGDPKKVLVTYISGEQQEFKSVSELAKAINVITETIYRRIGIPLEGRYTKRKMSHIKLITYTT